MIALDTNILVRFLVEDDIEQCQRARALVQKAVDGDSACYISDIVLCETVWVLASCYQVSREDIGDVLRRLLLARHLSFDSTDRIARALEGYRAGRGDFADYLIREHARSAGCKAIATFDRALLEEKDFVEPL